MLGCEYGQGYLFSRPVDNARVQHLLAQDAHRDLEPDMNLTTDNADFLLISADLLKESVSSVVTLFPGPRTSRLISSARNPGNSPSTLLIRRRLRVAARALDRTSNASRTIRV